MRANAVRDYGRNHSPVPIGRVLLDQLEACAKLLVRSTYGKTLRRTQANLIRSSQV